MKSNIVFILLLSIFLFSCSSSDSNIEPEQEIIFGCTDPNSNNYSPEATENDGSCAYETEIILEVPELFRNLLLPPKIPENNPQTIEGIALGRKLFYDPILSGDGTQACADCHLPENAFTDSKQFSIGIDGSVGTLTRNSSGMEEQGLLKVKLLNLL